MVKQLWTFILLTLSFQGCTQPGMDDKLIHELVSDYSRHSYFIAVMVKQKEGTHSYVITNRDLSWYFNAVFGFSTPKYETYMASVIKKKTPLEVNDRNLVKYNFIKVPEKSSLEKDMQPGKDTVISTYFDKFPSYYILNKNLSPDETSFLINTLFHWNIITRMDDETGYLIISGDHFSGHKAFGLGASGIRGCSTAGTNNTEEGEVLTNP